MRQATREEAVNQVGNDVAPAVDQGAQGILDRVEHGIAKIAGLLEEASRSSKEATQEQMAQLVRDVRSSLEETAHETLRDARVAMKERYWQTLLGALAMGFTLGFLAKHAMSSKPEADDEELSRARG